MTDSALPFIIAWVCFSKSDINRKYSFMIHLSLPILPDEFLVYSAERDETNN